MKSGNIYFERVRWLVRMLPVIMEEKAFALKGGTAINLFLRDLPRFSVDIDLTYLPLDSREVALKSIRESLKNIAKNLRAQLSEIEIRQESSPEAGKIHTRTPGGDVTIEVNLTLRGSVMPPIERDLCPLAQEQLEESYTVPMLSAEDLYGGKICAALTRQHPRDLFDIQILFENEGMTEAIRKAFLVYLVSHNRPIHEVLDPKWKELKEEFLSEFQGMTDRQTNLPSLEETRDQLLQVVRTEMTEIEKRFLLSFKRGEPEWDLLKISHVSKLPGVQWKLLNIQKMDSEKRKWQLDKLQDVLAL